MRSNFETCLGRRDRNQRLDLNWSEIRNDQHNLKAREVNRRLAQYVDVMIGNEEDFTACLGFEVEGVSENISNIDTDSFKKMIAQAVEAYPNFKATGTTLREVHTATVNDWSAICWHDGKFYESQSYPRLEILDRVDDLLDHRVGDGGVELDDGLDYLDVVVEGSPTAERWSANWGPEMRHRWADVAAAAPVLPATAGSALRNQENRARKPSWTTSLLTARPWQRPKTRITGCSM